VPGAYRTRSWASTRRQARLRFSYRGVAAHKAERADSGMSQESWGAVVPRRVVGVVPRSARRLMRWGPFWWPSRRRRSLIGLAALLASMIVIVIAVRAMDIDAVEQACADRPLGCSVVSGAATSAFTALLVSVVWIGGVAQFFALRRYRGRIRADPARVFQGSWQGELARLTGRTDLVRAIAHELATGPRREPVILVGDAGAGKTSLAMLLAQELAQRGLVPGLVPMRSESIPFDPEVAAVRSLQAALESQWVSPSVAEQICLRVRRAGLLVAILDGLDEMDPTAPGVHRQMAIAAALRSERLRIPVVATVRPRSADDLPGQRFVMPPIPAAAAAASITSYDRDDASTVVAVGRLDEVPFFLPWVDRAGLPVPAVGDHPVEVRRALLNAALADLTADHRVALGLLALGLCAIGEYRADVQDVLAVLGARGHPLDALIARSALDAAGRAGVAVQVPGSSGNQFEFTHTQLLVWAASQLLAGDQSSAEVLRVARLSEAADAFVWAASGGVTMDLALLREALAPDNVAIALTGIAGVRREDLDPSAVALVEAAGNDDPGLALVLAGALANCSAAPRVARLLLTFARHQSYEVRWRACRALAMGDASTLESIQHQLHGHLAELEAAVAAGHAVSDLALTQEGPLWFLPGLTAGCAGPGQADALGYLNRFQVVVEGLSAADAPGCLGAESSLAQGFKLAACTRPGALPAAAPTWLASESRFWYARIEALQALAYEAIARRAGVPDVVSGLQRTDPHPLVRRVAYLATRAIESGSADEWLWEDEMSVARTVRTKLRPEAIQTVADVALLLNLSQNGDQTARDRNARQDTLPPCLTSNDHRSRLTIGPGCADDCSFGLCPYHLDESYVWARGTFSEAFCRTVRHAEESVGLPEWYRGQRRRYLQLWRALEETGRR
jgi:hypothetical protein